MGTLRFTALLLFATVMSCGQAPQAPQAGNDAMTSNADSLKSIHDAGMKEHEVLLLTKYNSLDELKSVVQIQYSKARPGVFGSIFSKSEVRLTCRSGVREVTSILKTGVSESDFMRARDGSLWQKLLLGIRCPYAVINRESLMNIERLGRRRPWIYGKGDVAFYDLAETMVFNISAEDTVRMSPQDLSEKGYLNTFNHVTAQALMTSIYTEVMADFVADVHERKRMPELITGDFTEDQLDDLENGPVDNYIDLVNNEWGQELGKALRIKYAISRHTFWTPFLLADYLNDIQGYYSWAFQIGFKPFRPTDDMVVRFSAKINSVLDLEPY